MILYYAKMGGRLQELEDVNGAVWINIAPPFTQEELEDISLSYNIPLDFLTDSLDIDERSRYEREDDVRLIVVNTPIINETASENEAIYITVPIGLILIPGLIITITSFENPVLQLFLENKVKYFEPANPEKFVLQLMEQNVYRFLTCLKKLNLKRNLIEKELSNSQRSRELYQLLTVEKSLVYFVNTLSSNDLLKKKMKRTDYLRIKEDEEMQDLFEDIIIDNSQALEMANVYTNILSGTMEAYASIVSNNLNVVIQRLTLVTIILMVPTLIASYYGMNVDLPLIGDNPTEFYIIVLVSIFLSLGLAWFFRKKRLF